MFLLFVLVGMACCGCSGGRGGGWCPRLLPFAWFSFPLFFLFRLLLRGRLLSLRWFISPPIFPFSLRSPHSLPPDYRDHLISTLVYWSPPMTRIRPTDEPTDQATNRPTDRPTNRPPNRPTKRRTDRRPTDRHNTPRARAMVL